MGRHLQTTGLVTRLYVEPEPVYRLEVDILESSGMTVEVHIGPPFSKQVQSALVHHLHHKLPVTITATTDGLQIVDVRVEPASRVRYVRDDEYSKPAGEVRGAPFMPVVGSRYLAEQEVSALLDDMGIRQTE